MDTAVRPVCPAPWASPSLPSLAFASRGTSVLKFFSLKKMNGVFCSHELPFMGGIKVANRDSLLALFHLFVFICSISL